MSLKRFLVTGALLQTLAGAALATDPQWINNGFLTVPPQVDATAFINNGIISFATLDPFKTQNTLNYTNNFEMSGILGFDFALYPYPGVGRKPAATFFNRAPLANGRGGLIEGIDAGVGFNSKVLVMATNIQNNGFMEVGGQGLLRLDGTNVSVPLSTLAVNPIIGLGTVIGTASVRLDAGIFGRAWGSGAGNTRGSQSGVSLGTSPANSATNYPGSSSGNVSAVGGGGYAFANVQFLGFTNVATTNLDLTVTNVSFATTSVVEVAFVGPFSPVWAADAHFQPSSQPNNPWNAIGVVLVAPVPNPVMRTVDQVIVGISDEVVSRPSQTVLPNVLTNPASGMPARLDISRIVPAVYSGGLAGNTPYDPALIWGSTNHGWGYSTFTNVNIDTYQYDYYQVHVDNVATEHFPGVSFSNFSGRVEINARTLDLAETRLRGEGAAIITGNHVTGTSNMVLDVQNVLLDIGSTNGSLHLTDIIPVNVERLHGEVYTWAGSWTNGQYLVVATNNWGPVVVTTGTNTVTNIVQQPITNTVPVWFHVLVVNPVLETTTPVTTEKMFLRATNVVDDANTAGMTHFFTDAQNFTLNGSLTFAQVAALGLPAFEDFIGTNAPNILNFTNNGTIFVFDEAHFGDDRPLPYANFVNTGLLDLGSFDVRTAYFENPGLLEVFYGSAHVNALSAKLEGGEIFCENDISFAGNDLKLRNFNLTAGALYLNQTNAIFDTGSTASNQLVLGAGFNLSRKPVTGDLLGTHVSSGALFGFVQHTWAGADRGATPAGFSNNVAIGRLTLSNLFGILVFQGTDAHNGLYVDVLDLPGTTLASLSDLLLMDPSLTIYFAMSSPGSIPTEQLDGQLGGRLRWVRSYAGPNSSVSVLLPNGQTILVNKALRQSLTIDSDGDGLPNGVDPSPFDAPVLSRVSVTNQPPPSSALITWHAAAGTVYRVEYTTNQAAPVWQFLKNYTNTAATNGPVTVIDASLPASPAQRFYRVSYMP